jgi:deoxyribose-phosphate aldolase
VITDADLARRIDHTALRPETTRADVERLCRETREYGFAFACVAPVWVSEAARHLEGSPSGVCAVIGFPHGTSTARIKAEEARRALDDGAREVDMVMAIGHLKSGDSAAVERDIGAVVEAARAGGALVKVILETALLSDEQKVLGCRLAEAAGADFVKTSTGFGARGATVEDVRLLAGTVGGRLGVKAAGGIRSLDFALALLDAGATRLGCSASVALLEELGAHARLGRTSRE